MKAVFLRTILFIAFLMAGLNSIVSAQCSFVDNTQGALFITYERLAKVKTDNRKVQDGVILRIYNNSTCDVFITTGSAEKFYKPLPPNPTPIQRVFREIDYVLPNGVLVPEVQYAYRTRNRFSHNVLGDMFFGFKLPGTKSILFEIPFDHIDLSFSSYINLEFEWAWEVENRGKIRFSGINSSIKFWFNSLPDEVKRKIKKS